MSMQRPRGRIVYSTDPQPEPTPEAKAAPTPSKGHTVYVERDRKRRGGKTVTLVTGLPGQADSLRDLLKALQKLCGAGGTVHDGEIEVQGDHRERVGEYLTKQGYRVKYRGG